MVSEGRLGTVMLIPPRYNADRKLKLWVSAYNRGDAPVNFGSEDISIRLDSGPAIPAQDYDYLRMEAKQEARRELVAAWVATGLAEAAVAYIAVNNPALARTAAGWGVRVLQYNRRIVERRLWEAILRNYKTVLQTTTVDPGTEFGGGVISDQVALHGRGIYRMEIVVRFAGEDHPFLLRMASDRTHLSVQPDIPAVEPDDDGDPTHGAENLAVDRRPAGTAHHPVGPGDLGRPLPGSASTVRARRA